MTEPVEIVVDAVHIVNVLRAQLLDNPNLESAQAAQSYFQTQASMSSFQGDETSRDAYLAAADAAQERINELCPELALPIEEEAEEIVTPSGEESNHPDDFIVHGETKDHDEPVILEESEKEKLEEGVLPEPSSDDLEEAEEVTDSDAEADSDSDSDAEPEVKDSEKE